MKIIISLLDYYCDILEEFFKHKMEFRTALVSAFNLLQKDLQNKTVVYNGNVPVRRQLYDIQILIENSSGGSIKSPSRKTLVV